MTRQEIAAAALAEMPLSVRICGFDFEIVRWPAIEAAGASRYGECSTVEQKIRLSEQFASSQKLVDTFLHECLHAISWTLNIHDDDKEERRVNTTSTGLTALFGDNPWLAPWIEKYVRA